MRKLVLRVVVLNCKIKVRQLELIIAVFIEV
jgi:hypothetical protein